MQWEIVEARPVRPYKVWVGFAAGVSEEVDLAVAGKGVFRRWEEPGEFEKLFVDPETKTLAWPGDIDIAPQPIYEELVAKTMRATRA